MGILFIVVAALGIVLVVGFGIMDFFHKEKKDDDTSFDHKPDGPRSVFLKPIDRNYYSKTDKYTRRK